MRGKINKKSAFTLVEVMVATVILAVGIVVIFEVFLMSLDTINLFQARLNVHHFINEKFTRLQQDLNKPGQTFVRINESGVEEISQRPFKWKMELESQDVRTGLYQCRINVDWFIGSKRYSVKRVTLVKQYFSNVENFKNAATLE